MYWRSRHILAFEIFLDNNILNCDILRLQHLKETNYLRLLSKNNNKYILTDNIATLIRSDAFSIVTKPVMMSIDPLNSSNFPGIL